MEIKTFQKLMKDLYYHQDKERGINGTFLWFVEEVGEFSEAIRKYQLRKDENDIPILKNHIAEEMADIIAWISSIANLMDIDIQTSLYSKYPNKCPKCNKNPCNCNNSS